MSRHSSRGPAWDKTRLFVLDRDGWVCTQCGKELAGSDATVDHVIAKANGGSDDPSNLVSLCRYHNGQKQDRALIRVTWFNERWLDRV